MNTRQLSYLVAIAENGSLSAASHQLGISQPALSKYLLELEDELGAELFLRYKKKLYPTTVGETCLDAARRIILVKDQTYQAIASLTEEQTYTHTLTIGVTPLRGAVKVAHIFPAFRKRYPHTSIAFLEQYNAQLRQSVKNQTVNMALATAIDLEEPDLTVISANEEDLVLFVPSFHPLAPLASKDPDHLTAVDIRQFQDTPFLLGGDGSTIYKLAQGIFRQNHMNPTVVFRADNNLILKNMAESGAGVCLLPRSHMEPSSRVVYFSLRPNYYTHLSVLVPRDKTLTEEERYLIALIFASEYGNPHYQYHPTPLAEEILKEFHFPDAAKNLFL